MFKKFSNIVYYGQSKYQYLLIDDDFEEECDTIVFVSAIIITYSKRNLPVAPNLIRGMIFIKNIYGHTIDEQVISLEEIVPQLKENISWTDLKKDLNKYLLFS